MTDRLTVDTINSDQLDHLYERLEAAEAKLASAREWADYHANQCEDWCCDHAPKLLAMLDQQPAARRNTK